MRFYLLTFFARSTSNGGSAVDNARAIVLVIGIAAAVYLVRAPVPHFGHAMPAIGAGVSESGRAAAAAG
jgi:hypothetical protein